MRALWNGDKSTAVAAGHTPLLTSHNYQQREVGDEGRKDSEQAEYLSR